MSYGIICNADQLNQSQLSEFAAQAEGAGLDNIWVPELFGRDPFITCSVLLAATHSLRVGTAIANVYARDSRATKAAAYSLADAHDNRFELGLGVSNTVGNSARGHDWLPPVKKMTDFMDGYDAAELTFQNTANVPAYLAAHGPGLMNFAARRLDGAYSYLMNLNYTAEAKAKIGDKKLHLMQPTVFSPALTGLAKMRMPPKHATSIHWPLSIDALETRQQDS